MNEQVDEVKSKVDIVSLISEYVELRKAGRNYKAPCPFHSEKTPSFMVSPELQIFKCFGCGESGDAFTFLQKYEGMEFYEALKYLAEKTGVKLKPSKFDEGGEKEKLFKINSLASYFYNYILLKHPAGAPALNYLTKERRILPEMIKMFGLGFSPNTPFALKSYLVDKKNISLSEIERSGIIYRGEGRDIDRFRGRIIFPLFDHRGNNIAFAGRILPANDKGDMAKYINSPETEIYHKSKILYGLNITKSEIKKSKEAVIVEGELDTISSFQAGIKNVVAIKGSAVTSDQARLLFRFTPKITLALDADFAGNEAARRGLEILEAEGLEVRVCTLTGFKDPDEAAHKDPEALRSAIKNSKLVWDFVIDMLFSKHEKESVKKLSHELVSYLSTIRDEIIRAHYTNMVAQRLKVPFEAVSDEVRKNLNQKSFQKEVPVSGEILPSKKTRHELLEERLLSVIFKKDPMLLIDKKYDNLFNTPLVKNIRDEFVGFIAKHKKFSLKSFAKTLPDELVWGFSELIIKQIDGLDEENTQSVDRELLITEKELNIIKTKEKLEGLGIIIRESEEKKDESVLKKTQEKFEKTTRKLNSLVEDNIKGIIS